MSDSVEQALRPLRLVVGGLIAGLVMFAAIATFVSGTLTQADPQLTPVLLAVLGLLCVGSFVGRLAVRHTTVQALLDQARQWRTLSDPSEPALETYRRLTITGAGLTEGPGMFALVVYMLTGHILAVAVAAACVVLLLVQMPSRDRLRRFAESVIERAG